MLIRCASELTALEMHVTVPSTDSRRKPVTKPGQAASNRGLAPVG
jgi:hypothetical protein